MSPPNRNLAWAAALVSELARCGVRHAVVSPGSRSAPLALALAADPAIHTSVWLDERSAGFFALGLARATRRPVALACTSGTATANYLPALIEAHHSRVALLALTADRPPELRDCGAGQTIDQHALYGSVLRAFWEVPPPEISDRQFAHLRVLACRSAAAATGPPAGPVQLNLPFREPLDPEPDATDLEALDRLSDESLEGRPSGEPWLSIEVPRPPVPDGPELTRLAAWIAEEERGWICAGPHALDEAGARAVADLARCAGWPLLADALSGLRSGPHERSCLVDAHDAVLRCGAFVDRHGPRRILRFGPMPTSKAYRLLTEAHPEIEQIVVDPDFCLDPTALNRRWVRADPAALAGALRALLTPRATLPEYARTWALAGQVARRALDAELDATAQLSEPSVVTTLARHLPDPASLFVASSMPVRDVDGFWPTSERRLRVYGNRGANGIDGTLATALGTAAAGGPPCVALVGDLALLHDIGSTAGARSSTIDATVVVLDNDGGGIFEFLPVASRAERSVFEQYFSTPPGVDLETVLRGFDLPCTRATTPDALRDQLADSLARPGVQFIRVPTDRRTNRELHAKLSSRAEAALEAIR